MTDDTLKLTPQQFKWLEALVNRLHAAPVPSIWHDCNKEIAGMYDLSRVLTQTRNDFCTLIAVIRQQNAEEKVSSAH